LFVAAEGYVGFAGLPFWIELTRGVVLEKFRELTQTEPDPDSLTYGETWRAELSQLILPCSFRVNDGRVGYGQVSVTPRALEKEGIGIYVTAVFLGYETPQRLSLVTKHKKAGA
jgi:hypothetical protein